jgi:hypothetical protein
MLVTAIAELKIKNISKTGHSQFATIRKPAAAK